MPVFFLILACAFWGLSFPVIKTLHLEQAARLPDATTAFLSAWMQVARFGMATLILLPFIVRYGYPTRLELRQGLWIALCGGLAIGIQADGLAHTDASISAFLTQAYCIFIPLWTCLIHRKAPNARILLATFLVIISGIILSGIKIGHLRIGRGEIETIISALLFALQILSLENPKYANNRSMPVTFIMFVGIVVLYLPITYMLAQRPTDCLAAGASVPAFILICILAVFCSAGAYFLMILWQPQVSAIEAGLIYSTEPLFTAIYVLFIPSILGKLVGCTYINESITYSLVIGGFLIITANILMQWKRKPHPPAVAPIQ